MENTMVDTDITLTAAVQRIHGQLNKMDGVSGQKIFDEFSVVRIIQGKLRIESYFGPRQMESFRETFMSDISPIRQRLLESDEEEVGSFYFDNEAEGSLFDAFMKIGPDSYVIFNNILFSMTQLKSERGWIKAQVHFADLANLFMRSPLTDFEE